MQHHTKGSGNILARLFRTEGQTINNVKVVRALQTVQKFDDSFVIAVNRDIELHFNDVSARKLLGAEIQGSIL